MAVFLVTARDQAKNQKVDLEIDAPNEALAADQVIKRGLIPLDVKNKEESGSSFVHFGGKVKTKDKVLFSRQLASLLSAGIPLVQAIRMVGNQVKNKKFKNVIISIATDIEGGSSFSKALAKYPDIFSRAFIGVISAGETTGGISASMTRLADQQERDAETVGKIRGALIYPAVVVVVIFGVGTFMIVKVLPQVQVLYNGIHGVTLPLFTRLLLGISHFVTQYWIFIAAFLGVLLFFTFRWTRTLTGKRVVDRLKLNVPPLNRLFRKLYMARFSLTLGTLLESGVPLLQALEITSGAVANIYIAKSVDDATEEVKGGKALSSCLKGDPNFLELVPSMLEIGEKSGTVTQMMLKTADYYQKELDSEIKNITTVIEPALMIIVGVMALVLVAAILLPIYGLVGKIQ